MTGGDGHGRWRSRVRGLPETLGDLPAAMLAEEIETPGRRAGARARHLRRQPGAVDAERPAPRARRSSSSTSWSSIDLYVNETTRHADVILPPAWTLAEDHVDLLFAELRRCATSRAGRRRSSSAAPDERADWEILLELAERLGGGPTGHAGVDRVLRVRRARSAALDADARRSTCCCALGPHGDRFLPWSPRPQSLREARGARRTASTSARSSRASRAASSTATGAVHLAAGAARSRRWDALDAALAAAPRRPTSCC